MARRQYSKTKLFHLIRLTIVKLQIVCQLVVCLFDIQVLQNNNGRLKNIDKNDYSFCKIKIILQLYVYASLGCHSFYSIF